MIDWLSPVLGTVVLALLVTDVFQTVFHAEGRGGVVNRRQNGLIWAAIRRGDAWTGGSGRLLSLAGPSMAVVTIVVWTLLLWSGFALVYLPVVLDFHFTTGRAGGAIVEAIYYSGITAATLGQGDVVASGAWMRILTVMQALMGFSAVTIAVTYVLGVYRELVSAQTLAASIDARLTEADGNRTGAGPAPDVADWDRTIALRLAKVVEAHHNYPVLHFFRPRRIERSVPWQVARLHRQRRGATDSTLSSRVLARITRGYIREMHLLFVRGSVDPPEGDDGDVHRLDGILSMLGYSRYEDVPPG